MQLVSHLTSLTERGMLPVLLTRHGRTRYNAERRFVGVLDIPLDEEGLRQAQRWAKAYAKIPIQGVYCSPLTRARQTAEALAPATAIPGLQELDQGAFEGRIAAEVMAENTEFFAKWRDDPSGLRVAGGETVDECQARAVQALTQLAAAHSPGAPIVVVAHQMVLATILLHILELPLRLLSKVHQTNTAVNLLGYKQGRWTVHVMDDTTHLR